MPIMIIRQLHHHFDGRPREICTIQDPLRRNILQQPRHLLWHAPPSSIEVELLIQLRHNRLERHVALATQYRRRTTNSPEHRG